MSISGQILNVISSKANPSAVWQLFSQSMSQARNIAAYGGSVLLGKWNPTDTTPRGDTIKVLKIGGGLGLALWSVATMFRNHEEGRAVLTDSGNRDGSAVWSYSQALMKALSAGMTVSGMLMPGSSFGWMMMNVPALAVVPSVLALGMDHLQSIATCTSDHIFAKMAQFGLDNSLISLKNSDNPGMAFRSKMLPWWHRNIRALDEKVFHALGINFRRTHTLDNPINPEPSLVYA